MTLLSILFIFLSACGSAPVPTVTPTVIFPTPSPTIEPSATPDVIAPVLNDLQKDGINASYKNSMWILSLDGVEIPNAKLNEDGFTVTTDSGEINVPLPEMNTRVENANGVLVIKDEGGKAMAVFDAAAGKWLNPDQMTDEQKFELAPDNIDGYTKSNCSTVVDGILIYRDAEGTAQLAYNPLTQEKSTLQELGAIEIPLTDGTKWEMPAFAPDIPAGATAEQIEAAQIKALEDIVNFIVKDGVAWGDVGPHTIFDASQAELDFNKRAVKLPGNRTVDGYAVPIDKKVAGENTFLLTIASILDQSDSSFVVYESDEEGRRLMFVGMSAGKIDDLFIRNKVSVPTRPEK